MSLGAICPPLVVGATVTAVVSMAGATFYSWVKSTSNPDDIKRKVKENFSEEALETALKTKLVPEFSQALKDILIIVAAELEEEIIRLSTLCVDLETDQRNHREVKELLDGFLTLSTRYFRELQSTTVNNLLYED